MLRARLPFQLTFHHDFMRTAPVFFQKKTRSLPEDIYMIIYLAGLCGYAGAGLFDIAAVPNGSEYPPEHRTPYAFTVTGENI